MSDWTAEEINTLIALWPVASAAQIARRLHRPTGAISGKASRLRKEGVLPAGGVAKQYNVTPWPTRSPLMQMHQLRNAPAKTAGDARAMQPCSLAELTDRQCHWPLDLGSQVATMFCGGAVEPGRRYCAHHWRMARGGR